MNYENVIKRLEEMGEKKTRKAQKAQGASPKRVLGVPATRVRGLAKDIGTDHKLARTLWTSKYVDAQLLATLVADPADMDKRELNHWCYEIDYWQVSEWFAENIVLKSRIRGGRMRKWLPSEEEHVKLTALYVLRKWPLREGFLEEEELGKILKHLLKDFWESSDRVKQAMLYSFVTLGKRNPEFNDMILDAEKNLRKAKLDLGEGAQAKVPDLVEELTEGRVKARWETLVP